MFKTTRIFLLFFFLAFPCFARETAIHLSEQKAFDEALKKAKGKDLIIDNHYRIISDVNLASSDINLKIPKGGGFLIESGATLNLDNISLEAGRHQIFYGNGEISGNPKLLNGAFPEWFGAKGDNSADDIAAINKSLNFSKIVNFGTNTYKVSSPPKFKGGVIKGLPTINIIPGVHQLLETLYLDGAEGLNLQGQTELLGFSSVGSISGEPGSWTVQVNVKNPGNAKQGYFLAITHAQGEETSKILEGIWEIIQLSGNTITILNTSQPDFPPKPSIKSCHLRLIKTVFQTTAKSVFHLYGGILHSDGIVFHVKNSKTKDGTKAVSIAPRKNHKDNRHSLASAHFGPACGFIGAGNHGLVVGGNAFVEIEKNAAFCGNKQDGLHATEGGTIFAKFTVANGNGESGVMAEMGASVEVDGITACGNRQNGLEALGGGNIGGSQPTTFTAFNGRNGILAAKGGMVRATEAISSNNGSSGYKADQTGKIFAPKSKAFNNKKNGYFSTQSSFIDAKDSTSINNSIGYKTERNSSISALGKLSVFGNKTDFSNTHDGKFFLNEDNSIFQTNENNLPDKTNIPTSEKRGFQLSKTENGDLLFKIQRSNTEHFIEILRLKSDGQILPNNDLCPPSTFISKENKEITVRCGIITKIK